MTAAVIALLAYALMSVSIQLYFKSQELKRLRGRKRRPSQRPT